MTNQQDHIYIGRILNGDVNAYSYLVHKYQNMVFTMAFRILHNREEAEDAAQEAFVKCFKSLNGFKGDSKFSTWLYRIVYHTCLDKIKDQKRMVTSEIIDELHEGEIGLIDNVLVSIEQEERSKLIHQALSQLNEDEQMIVTLYYFEEMSLREISEIVMISMDNIKVKLFAVVKSCLIY